MLARLFPPCLELAHDAYGAEEPPRAHPPLLIRISKLNIKPQNDRGHDFVHLHEAEMSS